MTNDLVLLLFAAAAIFAAGAGMHEGRAKLPPHAKR